MTRLTDSDRLMIERLTYRPEGEPAYELIKSCLVWLDEVWSSPGFVDIPGSMINSRGVTDGKTQATQVYRTIQG